MKSQEHNSNRGGHVKNPKIDSPNDMNTWSIFTKIDWNPMLSGCFRTAAAWNLKIRRNLTIPVFIVEAILKFAAAS